MEYGKNASIDESQEEYPKSKSLSSSLSTDSESSSLASNHKEIFDQTEDEENLSTNSSLIKEVYDDNFEEAFKEINSIKKEYNYIGMDTEFPGVVYNVKPVTRDFYYRTMKTNVNSTKLIQLGISFTNKYGEFPQKYKYHTWQFNFKFDEKKDKFSQESLNLLKNNGINFEKLQKNGITPENFANKLLSSGLVLNPKFRWVSYQGSYDFAYLLRILIKDNLPETEEEFTKLLNLYFPSLYDVRMLIRDNENLFYGGLNKLIANLEIKRKGINHQAGSDSIATIEAFHQLREEGIIDNDKIKTLKNVLYGLGIGEDNENTIKYMNKNPENEGINIETQKNHNAKINMMNANQNYIYNNMLVNNNSINNMLYYHRMQSQKHLNNIILNNRLQYALIKSYQTMRSSILINNMKLVQVNS